jgi:uncharacterized protein
MNSFSQLETLTAELPPKHNDILGAMVVTLDGRVLANTAVSTKPNQLAAMTSSSLALSTRIIETINGGSLNEVYVSGSDGNILVYSVGQKAVLVVITRKNPNLAMINWEARKIINEMCALLDGIKPADIRPDGLN